MLNFIVYNSQCYFYIYTIWLSHLDSYLSDTQSDDSSSDLENSNMDKGYKLI